MQAWRVNKSARRAIEAALFKKTTPALYSPQSHVLSTLVFSSSPNDIQRLQQLAQTFLAQPVDPDLGLPELLHRLKLISIIYQIPLDITPIIQQLPHNEEIALSCLVDIWPALVTNKETAIVLSPLIDIMVDNLKDSDTYAFTPLRRDKYDNRPCYLSDMD